MASIFISYAREDASIAQGFHNRLTAAGLSAFLDTASLSPGSRWSPKLREELKAAGTVLVLASQKAVRSAMVNQELGGAAVDGKKVIPVVWDMDPAQLPGWLREYQALDFRGQNESQIQMRLEAFVQQLVREKQQLQVIAAVILVGMTAIALFAK